MERDKMEAIVAQANALGADLVVQTGDMIDISPSYIPDYVRAFRELKAPLGVVTTIGNHDYYTGEREVIRGVQDAGSVFIRNAVHVIEQNGSTLLVSRGTGVGGVRIRVFAPPEFALLERRRQ